MRTVKLTYFRKSGKYYSEGEFEVEDDMSLYDIWDIAHNMIRSAKMPGMVEGYRPYTTQVVALEHPLDHPHLITHTEGE